jgi:diguanylate cyclase (GGDEF)-like protein
MEWIIASLIAGTLLGFHYGRKRISQESSRALEAKTSDLEVRIEGLSKENSEYISLLTMFSDAARFLTSNLSYDEVVSSIIRLVENIIPARFIGLYIYDRTSESLRLTSSFGDARESKKIYLMGEGMVGSVAKNKLILTSDTYHNSAEKRGDLPNIAAPVFFGDELLGVICIRGITNPSANDKMLLSMISGIAGVSLRNAIFLTGARKEAETDPLTKLYNRRFFFQRAEEEMLRAKGYGSPLSVFIFDIDRFKHYNDTNGHTEGDRLLVSLSDLVREITRKTSVIARYGGEEFIVLLPNVEKEEAFLYAERVRRLIENHPFPNREKQPLGFVSVSGGIAEFPSDGDTLDVLLKLADEALYRAKEGGRNRIEKALKRGDPGI